MAFAKSFVYVIMPHIKVSYSKSSADCWRMFAEYSHGTVMAFCLPSWWNVNNDISLPHSMSILSWITSGRLWVSWHLACSLISGPDLQDRGQSKGWWCLYYVMTPFLRWQGSQQGEPERRMEEREGERELWDPCLYFRNKWTRVRWTRTPNLAHTAVFLWNFRTFWSVHFFHH